MHYRADVFTSSGRLQFFANDTDTLRDMIDKVSMFVWGWQIVDLTNKKAVDYRAPGGGFVV